jgi:glycosyltransferase involved in cell wall biosynthesis
MTIVTVITPSYNQGRYIEDTIRSVLNQEGDFSLDYIIIDGGSTDNSVEIIRKYETLLHRGEWPIRCKGITYRWLSEKDKGQTDAIMKGFRMADGQILSWLNSDDTYLSSALTKAVDSLIRQPDVSILYGRSYYTNDEGAVIGNYSTEPFDLKRLAMFNFICQPSAFFRKSALTAVGGLDSGLHYAMDYDLWIRLGQRFEFRYLPEFLSTYRLHEESKTVSPAAALANHKEALDTVNRHYGWSPLNRVYMYSYYLLKSRLPASLAKLNLLLLCLSLPVAVVTYVRMNKGIRPADLKMINPSNMRKLFMDWQAINKVSRP